MRQKLFSFFVLVLSIPGFSNAQVKKTGIVKGKLMSSTTKTPFNDLKITIPDLSAFTTSDGEGNFELSEIPFGRHTVVIRGNNAKNDTLTITVDQDVVDLHDITIYPDANNISAENNEIPTIAISDNTNTSSEDDGVGVQNTGAAMESASDPFLGAIWELFGLYNFHYRGYVNNPHQIQVNGYTVNDVETNSFSWDQLGRLYSVFRSRSTDYGITHSDYTYGSANGSAYYDVTAANQQKETKISYTFSDRNYSNGVTLTKTSGPLKNGWSYSFSFAKRYEKEGYVPGTFYDDYSYQAGVSKVVKKGTFSLTTFGSPIDHGKGGSGTAEIFGLSGTNYYNRNWGEYDGQKLNARVQRQFRPITILNYEYNPSDKTRWNTVAGYEFGKDKNSFLDGYNSPNPYGDYYRNLPSYYLTMVPPDSATANQIRQQILTHPQQLQIDWNRLYQDNYANTQTLYNVNGIAGNNFTGRQSEYVLSNNVKDLKKFTFNTNIEHSLNEHATIYGGASFISQSTETYNQVANLLGGDYFVNFNQFPAQQYIGKPNFNQNNLNDPNALIRTGDKYGYDYSIRLNNTLAWGQAVYNYNKFNFFAAVNAGDVSFNRDGYMRNGLFPNNSYGTSTGQNFVTYAAKGGVAYNINARNSLFLNGAYSTSPPSADNTYISAGTRDFTVSKPTVQNNQSVEAGYNLKSSKITAHVIGYVTDIKNITEIKRFYNDDPAFNTFVNYVMQGENTRQIGTEISLNYKLTHAITLTGVASLGQAFYTNRPTINEYLDNDTAVHATPGKAYIQNYYLSTGPQTTYIFGVHYRPRRDYYANLSFNYFDRHYVEIDPNRRATAAAGLIPAGSPMWHKIFDQEELPSVFTVDLRAGKTFQLSRTSKMFDNLSHNTVLVLSASVGNLLNNKHIINFGYEQLRYDFTNNNPDKFANKYIYGMGINFSVTATLRF